MLAMLTALLLTAAPDGAPAPSMTPAQYGAVMEALIADPHAPCVVTGALVDGAFADRYVVCLLRSRAGSAP